jgi:hypothetical protein
MRNSSLHDALRAFSFEAARLLTRDLEAGAELPFEVAEEPGGPSPLYRYRPLTGRFVAERWPSLRALPACEAAGSALGAGAATYLRRLGATGADAEPALQAMLERLYEDLTSFAFPEERFERVYAELERALYAGSARATVVAGVHGLALTARAADLGDDLALVPAAGLDAPWLSAAVACRLEREVEGDIERPAEEARERFRTLLTALRLLGADGVTVDPLAHVRVDESPWQPLALGTPAYARGEEWTLAEGDVAELRELLGVLDGPGRGPTVRWALGRFEMGCDRGSDLEALSDHLLALRALVDGGDDLGRASLPLRVAALCAEESARRGVQRRVELAFALERFAIGGGGAGSYAELIGSESPRLLVAEVEEHTRGLLRDVLCGYLDPDLARVADEILLRGVEPIEIHARDTRAEAELEPVQPAPPPSPPARAAAAGWVATAGLRPGVDQLADWDFIDP